MNQKVKVALLFGGRSAEHEVSLSSAGAIFDNLDKNKYDVFSIFINKKGNWRPVVSPLLPKEKLDQGQFYSFLPWNSGMNLPETKADIFFPVLHGPYGEDGTIQGLFEMADVPYVAASVMASALGMDKATAKIIFLSKKLPVAKYLVLGEEKWLDNQTKIFGRIKETLRFPVFVKPSNLGSSVGISKVKDPAGLGSAIDTAFRFDRKILIEEGISGREFECSVLGNSQPRASLPGEVIPYREFYDYRDKYIEGKTRFAIPADIPSSLRDKIQEISMAAYKAIDCSGMARVDFFYQNETESLYLNEINTIPGFTEISMYPKLWEVSGIPFPDLLDKLIELGFEKHRAKKRNWEGTL
jgi:D-alanine-D-alanine ligase